jgi:hypothetical protein
MSLDFSSRMISVPAGRVGGKRQWTLFERAFDGAKHPVYKHFTRMHAAEILEWLARLQVRFKPRARRAL